MSEMQSAAPTYGGMSQASRYYPPAAAAGYYQQFERAYSIVNTEPTLIRKDRTPILIDPILERHVKSYMTWSLFNLLFCWFVPGIFTTLLSLKVMQLNDSRNFKAAYRLSERVLLANMIISGVGVFLVLVLFPIIYMAIYPYLPKINW
jgi:hypothetical protein